MPLLLSIDTSTTVCSVALHRGPDLVASYDLFVEKSSSGMLTALIRDIVHQTGYQLSDLSAVAVAKGPGSYTGLRIGVSTAKGLCFALDKPLLAVNTLEAMAWQVKSFYSPRQLLCPMIDARRMEVYCAVYDAEGHERYATSAQVIDEHSFEDILKDQSIVFFGSGATKCKLVLQHHANAIFIDQAIHPSARTVGLLAVRAYAEACFEDVAAFEPFYLKEFVSTTSKNYRAPVTPKTQEGQ